MKSMPGHLFFGL
jgi:hypothetical protein